jgi:PadR family transcriptional regulator PadR
MTLTVQLVLRALLAEPGRVYGFEVIRGTGLASGTIYPILARLEEAGWLEGERETINPQAEGRPPRKYYRLTAEGTSEARKAVARGSARLAALGVTEAPRRAGPPSIGGVEIGVTMDERQPPGVVGIVSRGRDSSSVSAFSLGASKPEPEQDAKPVSKGPCEHRIRPGAYCRTCERLI